MKELSDKQLDALIYDAIVDCYGEEEQLGGFTTVIQNDLAVPFKTTVLGVAVTVEGISLNESGVVAVCVRGGHRQAISIVDLPLPDPPPAGSEWIAAYRRWARNSRG